MGVLFHKLSKIKKLQASMAVNLKQKLYRIRHVVKFFKVLCEITNFCKIIGLSGRLSM